MDAKRYKKIFGSNNREFSFGRFIAYIIPIGILIYVVFINYYFLGYAVAEEEWDLYIDFSDGVPELIEGDFEIKNGCAYFDGKTRLTYTGTKDEYESGPFTVVVEWSPENIKDDSQQIVGHYNWELYQESDKVRFNVGRMDNSSGKFYSLEYPIGSDFLNEKHTVIAVYNPKPDGNGYIELFVDNDFAGRTYFGSSEIFQDYNKKRDLSLGKSQHKSATYYEGCIYRVSIINKNLNPAENIKNINRL